MIPERMIELSILLKVHDHLDFGSDDKINYKGNAFNIAKFKDRLGELLDEFLDPYIIESTSKEA